MILLLSLMEMELGVLQTLATEQGGKLELGIWFWFLQIVLLVTFPFEVGTEWSS